MPLGYLNHTHAKVNITGFIHLPLLSLSFTNKDKGEEVEEEKQQQLKELGKTD